MYNRKCIETFNYKNKNIELCFNKCNTQRIYITKNRGFIKKSYCFFGKINQNQFLSLTHSRDSN